MAPFLYLAIKSFYWTNGKTIGKVMWCNNRNVIFVTEIELIFIYYRAEKTKGEIRKLGIPTRREVGWCSSSDKLRP